MATVRAWEEGSRFVERFGGFSTTELDFQVSGRRIRYGLIYLDALPVLGVEPLLGRWYAPDEIMNGQWASTIVISYDMWQTQFAATRT